jgi:hypothetical protein
LIRGVVRGFVLGDLFFLGLILVVVDRFLDSLCGPTARQRGLRHLLGPGFFFHLLLLIQGRLYATAIAVGQRPGEPGLDPPYCYEVELSG